MIVGTGSIAKLLNDRVGFRFIARGVSDSRVGCEQDRNERCAREKFELSQWIEAANNEEVMLVYFGTISKFIEPQSFYVRHKFKMESMIKELSANYIILNLGNVWECTNPNTFRNAIKSKQAKGEAVEIWDEWKYMISKEQLNFITDNLPRIGKHEISIFGEMLKVKECLAR